MKAKTPPELRNFRTMPPQHAMEIKNPRRILAVGAPGSGVLSILKGDTHQSIRCNLQLTSPTELTGSAPELTTFEGSETTAGLSHEWRLETKYYTATIPIWLDEITDVAEWRTEFTKSEAREVITVLGSWIYCFKKPADTKDLGEIKDTMQAIHDVIERACGCAGDNVCLAVAMPQSTVPYLQKSGEEWEELCIEYGFEYVDFEAKGKNVFGEAVGIQRVREALEAGEWESGADLEFDGDEGFDGTFAAEEVEMNMELFGMKDALHGEEGEGELDDKDVEELEAMMRKMVAIKGAYTKPYMLVDTVRLTFAEMGEGMDEVERKRFAAKAVNNLMKGL